MGRSPPLLTRWVSKDCKVWEKRTYGWKFLGVAKSLSTTHVLILRSHDCDHPDDIFPENYYTQEKIDLK